MPDNSPTRSVSAPAAAPDPAPVDRSGDDDALFSIEPLRNWTGYSLRSVRRHPAIAIATALIVGLLGGILIAGAPPSYQTSTTILLRAGGAATDSGVALTLDQASRQADGIVTRRASLDRMIDDLGLDEDDIRKPLFGRLGDGLIEAVLGEPSAREQRQDLRRDLRSALSAEPSAFGESVVVSVTWGDARQAQQIADSAFAIFYEDREIAEISPKREAVRLLAEQTEAAASTVADLRTELGLEPQQDAPQGSDLLTAIGEERDLRAKLQTAQIELERAEEGLQYQYALLQPAELPLKPISSNLPRYGTLLLLVLLCVVGACVAVDQRRGLVLEAWQVERRGFPVLATVSSDGRRDGPFAMTAAASLRRPLRVAWLLGAVWASAPAAYLLALTTCSWRSRRRVAPGRTQLAVVVPAHDEAETIGSTVRSLQSSVAPASSFRIVVVADNCSDDTASVAAGMGATVLVREDDLRRGKGPALNWAFGEVLADPWVEGVVVVDADTVVAPDLLDVVAGHFADGAEAVQVDYRVRNPDESWRTQLLDVAFTCKNQVRPDGRWRAGGTAGLNGNGMAFPRSTLERVPYSASSAVEDLEYSVLLARAGTRVTFAPETFVAGDMPATADGSESQRTRWELGRAEIRRTHGPALLAEATRRRSFVLADAAADLYVPPLGSVVSRMAIATAATLLGRRLSGRGPLVALAVGSAGIGAHVLTGVARSQSGWSAVSAMLRVPSYLIWKRSVRASRAWRSQREAGTDWSRTQRSDSLRTSKVEE